MTLTVRNRRQPACCHGRLRPSAPAAATGTYKIAHPGYALPRAEAEAMMDLRVLGALDVRVDGRALLLGAPKQRSVLALLAVQANHVVGLDELVDELWHDRSPPNSAVANVRSYAANLRRMFRAAGTEQDRIIRRGSGYLLHAEPDEIDLLAFQAESQRGREAADKEDYPAAMTLLGRAVTRWREPMLAGLSRGPVLEARCVAAEAELINVTEQLAQLHIEHGDASTAVPSLQLHVRRHPLRERAHVLLIRALHRSGDTAGALSACARARELLAEELDIEPGPELQRLHHMLLNRELVTIPAPGALPPRLSRVPIAVPREIPPDVSYFVGRRDETNQIRSVLTSNDQSSRRRPAVAVIFGRGGAGKSALAMHAGHQIADSYPDGQLYVDLLGSSPGLRPLMPVEALRRLLRSLGVPRDDLPDDEAAAAGLLRSVTAGRRYLFVFDNARDTRQVLSLVPSSATCGVIITSRQPLATLDAEVHLHLWALSPADGLAFLEYLTGDRRMDRATAERIVGMCECLPLALRIAAGRLASRTDLAPTDLAERLADRSRRLDELELDGSAVRSCIRVGYEALTAGESQIDQLAARAFRALGLLTVLNAHPLLVAAMLAEPEVGLVESALGRLVSAQLLTAVNGRYVLHDLVRLVAGELAVEEDNQVTRTEQLQRAMSYYVHNLVHADHLIRPGRLWLPDMPDPFPVVAHVSFAERGQARQWLEDELGNVIAAADQASELARDIRRFAVWLTGAVQPTLVAFNELKTQHRLGRLALEAATSDPTLTEEAVGWAHVIAGRSESDLGNGAGAVALFERGLALLSVTGNVRGVALCLNALAVTHAKDRGDLTTARDRLMECLDHARRHRLDAQVGNTLLNLGNIHIMLGELDHAAAFLESALGLWQERNDDQGMGHASTLLSVIECHRGRLQPARKAIDEALIRIQRTGDPLRTCRALLVSSEIGLRSGDHSLAVSRADAALSLARSYRYPYGEAAALRQQAKIAAATGRTRLAAALQADADTAFAALAAPPDLAYERVLRCGPQTA